MADPRRTIELLDELERLGFSDSAFSRLHHARKQGRDETIGRHRAYCAKTAAFQPEGDNERTQRRLMFVLERCRASPASLGHPSCCERLAEEAYRTIPPVD